jgi:hypothetical protein
MNGPTIPSDIAIEIAPSFLEVRCIPPTPQISNTFETSKQALRFVAATLSTFASPVWRSNFPLFLMGIVHELQIMEVPETGYYGIVRSEISLGRCLLTSITVVARSLPRIDSAPVGVLTQNLFELCDAILVGRLSELMGDNARVGRFVLFRTLSDIWYSRRNDLWCAGDPALVEKVTRLSECRPDCFKIGGHLLSRPLHEVPTVREYVSADENWCRAAGFLSQALFQTNPFDILYYVYLSLSNIKIAAVSNMRRNLNSNDEITISFDDAFGLFFMVFLGSDLFDIFAVNAFVTVFAPERISSAFEYARTMLEALDLHIRALEVDSLIAGGY